MSGDEVVETVGAGSWDVFVAQQRERRIEGDRDQAQAGAQARQAREQSAAEGRRREQHQAAVQSERRSEEQQVAASERAVTLEREARKAEARADAIDPEPSR